VVEDAPSPVPCKLPYNRRRSLSSKPVRRPRTWLISFEEFRELRHSCFLDQKRCADFVGVSLRTVRHWDTGKTRVPWSVVRLLRLLRLGDLGALDDSWTGWTVNRNGLWSPTGQRYNEPEMSRWWLTVEQSRLFREAYDVGLFDAFEAKPRGSGTTVPCVPGHSGRSVELLTQLLDRLALLADPSPAQPALLALPAPSGSTAPTPLFLSGRSINGVAGEVAASAASASATTVDLAVTSPAAELGVDSGCPGGARLARVSSQLRRLQGRQSSTAGLSVRASADAKLTTDRSRVVGCLPGKHQRFPGVTEEPAMALLSLTIPVRPELAEASPAKQRRGRKP
jgi:DNA-binding transcriptional regulator YiaG